MTPFRLGQETVRILYQKVKNWRKTIDIQLYKTNQVKQTTASHSCQVKANISTERLVSTTEVHPDKEKKRGKES